MSIKITKEMKDLVDRALSDKCPCILGTASLNGYPNLSYKGSVVVLSGDKIAFWERARRGGFTQLSENPNVVIMYRNAQLQKAWRFYGEAYVHESGMIKEQVMHMTVDAELERDPDRHGAAVVIKVNRITSLSGEVLQKVTS